MTTANLSWSRAVVDKDKSMAIAADLADRLSRQKEFDKTLKYCLNHKMSDHHCDPADMHAVDFTHKLSVITINVVGDSDDYPDEHTSIEDYYHDIITGKYDQTLDHALDDNCGIYRSHEVEIYKCEIVSETDNPDNAPKLGIKLKTYLYEVAECDVSYPTFTYDDTLRCWIIRNRFWGAEQGIDDCGRITILDFSDYFLT